MDKVRHLSECRKLLRLIECDSVTDTSDENLYDILIRSEEKKAALLTWLIQSLFSSEHCSRNSLEDLSSMFMSNAELKTFLKGTMSPAHQFSLWKLIMNTVKQKKNPPNELSPDSIVQRVLSGSLLNEYLESWNQKIEKPAISFHNKTKRVPDFQTELNSTREHLNQLKSLTESLKKNFEEQSNTKNKDNIIEDFIKSKRALDEELSHVNLPSLNCPGLLNSSHFTQDSLNNQTLEYIKQNLIQLRDMMDADMPKNTNAVTY